MLRSCVPNVVLHLRHLRVDIRLGAGRALAEDVLVRRADLFQLRGVGLNLRLKLFGRCVFRCRQAWGEK